jgi:hypothetical protein
MIGAWCEREPKFEPFAKQFETNEYFGICDFLREKTGIQNDQTSIKTCNLIRKYANGLLAHCSIAPPSCPCPSLILFDLLDTMMLWMNSFHKSHDFVNQVMFWMDLFDKPCDLFDEMTSWMNCFNESSDLMIGQCFERIQLINRLMLLMIWCYSGIRVVALWCRQWSDVTNKLMIPMNGCDQWYDAINSFIWVAERCCWRIDAPGELRRFMNWCALALLRVCGCAMHSRRSWPAGTAPSWDVWRRNEFGGSDEY